MMKLEHNGIKRVVAAVSGGADSTALLAMLRHCGIETFAVHCNFHLRGSESDRDMHFVEDLCKRWEIPLKIFHFDVADYRSQRRISIEEACRELRYEKLREFKSQLDADRIALGHTMDDQTETVLLNLLRGSGVRGLRGMLPDNGELWRPLLSYSHKDLVDFLRSFGESFVVDSTNLQSDYRRNFLRNEVIPLIETRWPQARKSICRTATNMAHEENVLEQVSLEWRLRRWAAEWGANSSQCEEMIRAVKSGNYQSGKFWKVPTGRISAERGAFEFIPDGLDSDFNIVVERISGEAPDFGNSSNDVLITPLAPDRVVFRRPDPGDRIRPLGMSGSMKVSKVLKDAKLSRRQKESILIAQDRSSREILWIEGLKRGNCALVNGDSPGCVYRYRILRDNPDECQNKSLIFPLLN